MASKEDYTGKIKITYKCKIGNNKAVKSLVEGLKRGYHDVILGDTLHATRVYERRGLLRENDLVKKTTTFFIRGKKVPTVKELEGIFPNIRLNGGNFKVELKNDKRI